MILLKKILQIIRKMINILNMKIKYFLLLIILPILSGCGNCIKSGGINEKIENIFFESNYEDIETKSHVFDTGITINSGFLSMKITPSNLDFCYGVKNSIDIPTNSNGTLGDEIILYAGDVAHVSLVPFAEIEVTADICNNKDPRIYYWNSSNCINGYKETVDDGSGNEVEINYPSEIGMIKQIMLPIKGEDALNGESLVVVNKDIKWITTGKGYSSFDTTEEVQDIIEEDSDAEYICKIFSDLGDSACTINDFDSYDTCFNKYGFYCAQYSQLCYASTQYVSSFCGALCEISLAEDDDDGNESSSYTVESDNFNTCGYMSTLTAKGYMKQQTSETESTIVAIETEAIPGITILDSNDNIAEGSDAEIIFANKKTLKGTNTSALLTNLEDGKNKNYKISVDMGDFKNKTGGYKLQINHSCIAVKNPLQYKIGSGEWINVNMEEGSATFKPADLATGRLYLQATNPPDGSYATNTGGFEIEVKSKRTPIAFFSSFLNSLRKKMLQMMYGPIAETPSGDLYNLGVNSSTTYGVNEPSAVGSIYSNLIRSFSNTIQVAMVLSISMFGLLFLMGAIRNTQVEIIGRVFRFAIVFVLLGEKSYIFFYQYILIFFNEFSVKLLSIFTSATSSTIETSNPFTFVDVAINPFFYIDNWLRVIGLAFTGPFGFIVFFMMLYIIKMLFTTMIQASLIYFISILIVAILTSVAPIFISMLLFTYTKRIFDSWIKIMLQFVSQPIILFTVLTMLTQILNIIFFSILNFDLCPQCVLCVEFVPDMAGLCLLTAMVPTAYDTNSSFTTLLSSTFSGSSFMGLPFSLGAILSIILIVGAMEKFIAYSGVMSELLFGMVIQANIGRSAQGIMGATADIFGKGSQAQASAANKEYHKHVNEHQKDLGNARAGLNVQEERKNRENADKQRKRDE